LKIYFPGYILFHHFPQILFCQSIRFALLYLLNIIILAELKTITAAKPVTDEHPKDSCLVINKASFTIVM